MAIVKDPKKTPASRSDKAAASSPADTPIKQRDDFSFDLNNLYRRSDEKAEELEASQLKQAEEFRSTIDQLNESNKFLSADDMEKKGILTLSDLLRIDPLDERAQSMRTGVVTDYEAGKKYYVVGKELEKYEQRRTTQSAMGNLGLGEPHSSSKPAKFEIRTAGNIKADLVESINHAAKVTGVPPALLGAMAGIESGFNDPKMQKSPSGALGVLQQTGGYRDAVWAKYGDFVAQHAPAAREAMKGGLTKSEKIELAFDEKSAFIIAGLRAKELEKKYGVDLNTPKGMAIVYLEHNSGEGSVKKLLNGQMTDSFIRNWNPAIYRGNDTPQAVIAATERKMAGYANAYEKVSDSVVAKAGVDATVAIAKASASSADALKVGTIASLTNKTDDSNLDAKDLKMAKLAADKGPAPIPS